MNIVDSSGWLEYFADGQNADFFAEPIRSKQSLIVPTISITEVFKRVLQQRGESAALQSTALMQQGEVVPLDIATAINAAKLGLALRLPLADSVILATAQLYRATLWTQDADFKGLPGVQFTPKA
ncbi:MAG: type II toxin-antitoxin system VapC family toxin [Vicinamibacteria bacterium]